MKNVRVQKINDGIIIEGVVLNHEFFLSLTKRGIFGNVETMHSTYEIISPYTGEVEKVVSQFQVTTDLTVWAQK